MGISVYVTNIPANSWRHMWPEFSCVVGLVSHGYFRQSLNTIYTLVSKHNTLGLTLLHEKKANVQEGAMYTWACPKVGRALSEFETWCYTEAAFGIDVDYHNPICPTPDFAYFI